MENKSKLDPEYSKIISNNPDKKFVLYLRTHPGNSDEDKLKSELVNSYGEYKELPDQRLVIYIVKGNNVQEFIDRLNTYGTGMYLSFIQLEDELKKKN
jgi:hypothetical protein